jgi:hypothetical protein
MFCMAGGALLYQFETAAQQREEAKDDLLRAHENHSDHEERLYAVKEKYGDAFVAWVTHRSLCVDCRATSFSQDHDQFASL